MSKAISFRAKKIDYAKPLPIFRTEQIADFDEQAIVTRGLPQVATGVEKEEEEEHHLQAVISASQVNYHGVTYIPTPSVELATSEEYDRLYPASFRLPKTLIHHSHTIEHLIPISYNLDDDDVAFLARVELTTSDKLSQDNLETVMDHLEKVSKQRGELATVKDIERILSRQYAEALPVIFDHWHSRRTSLGRPLVSTLKFDHAAHHESDPFICFRRRELKHSRKTRRTDNQAYEKMIKLRSEMETLRTLLEMVCRRDRMKKECLELDQRSFQQRALVRDWKRQHAQEQRLADVSELYKPIKKKHAKYAGSLPTKLRIKFSSAAGVPTTQVVSAEQRRRLLLETLAAERGISYAEAEQLQSTETAKRRLDDMYDDFTDMAFLVLPQTPKRRLMKYATASLSKSSPAMPFVRRRIGRHGRILYDRMVTRHLIEHLLKSPTMLHDSHNDSNNNNNDDNTSPEERALERLASAKRARRFEASDDEEEWLTAWPSTDSSSSTHSLSLPAYVHTQHPEHEFYSYYLNHYMDAPGVTPLIPSTHYPSPTLAAHHGNGGTHPSPSALQTASATMAQLTQQRLDMSALGQAAALKAARSAATAPSNPAAAALAAALNSTLNRAPLIKTPGSPTLAGTSLLPTAHGGPAAASVASRQLAALQQAQQQQMAMNRNATSMLRDQLLAKQQKQQQAQQQQQAARGGTSQQPQQQQSSPLLRPPTGNTMPGSPQFNLAFLQQQLNNPALAETARRQLQALLRINKLANSPLAAAAQPHLMHHGSAVPSSATTSTATGHSATHLAPATTHTSSSVPVMNPLASMLAANAGVISSLGPAQTATHVSNASAAAAMQAAAAAASKMVGGGSAGGVHLLNASLGRSFAPQQQSTQGVRSMGSPRLMPQLTAAQMLALQQQQQQQQQKNAAIKAATTAVGTPPPVAAASSPLVTTSTATRGLDEPETEPSLSG